MGTNYGILLQRRVPLPSMVETDDGWFIVLHRWWQLPKLNANCGAVYLVGTVVPPCGGSGLTSLVLNPWQARIESNQGLFWQFNPLYNLFMYCRITGASCIHLYLRQKKNGCLKEDMNGLHCLGADRGNMILILCTIDGLHVRITLTVPQGTLFLPGRHILRKQDCIRVFVRKIATTRATVIGCM